MTRLELATSTLGNKMRGLIFKTPFRQAQFAYFQILRVGLESPCSRALLSPEGLGANPPEDPCIKDVWAEPRIAGRTSPF